jgi:carbamoyl-phosphate synthase small subunit
MKHLISRCPHLRHLFGASASGLAYGGKEFKLKFGHRGGNQPVKDLEAERFL